MQRKASLTVQCAESLSNHCEAGKNRRTYNLRFTRKRFSWEFSSAHRLNFSWEWNWISVNTAWISWPTLKFITAFRRNGKGSAVKHERIISLMTGSCLRISTDGSFFLSTFTVSSRWRMKAERNAWRKLWRTSLTWNWLLCLTLSPYLQNNFNVAKFGIFYGSRHHLKTEKLLK